MTDRLRRMAVLTCLTLTMGAASLAEGADEKPAVGTWQLDYEYMGNSITDLYEIKAGADGALTGRILRAGKEVTTLEKIKVEGDKVTFEAKGTTEGTDWKVDFSGVVKGDEIDGMVKITVNDQTSDLPWKPKRVK
jgi:hypothetical protein